jgi:hypothetical protein
MGGAGRQGYARLFPKCAQGGERNVIRMLTAHTSEIDFPDDALAEISEQLDLENNLLQNAVGIVHCGYGFAESGFIRMLCDKLPFEVVGTTTISCASGGEYDANLFSLTVLTGDDISFSVVRSEPLSKDFVEEPIGAACRRAAAASSEKPAMILAYMPLDAAIGTSRMLSGITSSCDGAVVFGSLPCDGTSDYRESYVILNGETFSDAAVLVFLYGDVRPRFFIENVNRAEDMQEQQGVITESDGCLLKSVNNMPFLDYIADIGISPDVLRGLKIFPVPFKVNYNEGTKSLIRVLHSVTPEGHAVFAGDMPLGGSFCLQRFDYGNVMETIEHMAHTLSSLEDVSGVMLYSCIGRSLLLGLSSSDEMRALTEILDGKMPFHFSYAGGELCPLEDENHVLMSHSHSYSLVACVF